MDIIEIENRKEAIKILIEAGVRGEDVKRKIRNEMRDAGINPDFSYPEPIGTEEQIINGDYDEVDTYDDNEVDKYYANEEKYFDFLDESVEHRKLQESSHGIINEHQTLEEIAKKIEDSELEIDMFGDSDVDVYECKPTFEDQKCEGSYYDEYLLHDMFKGKYDKAFQQAAMAGIDSEDIARIVLEEKMSIQDLPREFLFDLHFIDSYIKQSIKIQSIQKETDESIMSVMKSSVGKTIGKISEAQENLLNDFLSNEMENKGEEYGDK